MKWGPRIDVGGHRVDLALRGFGDRVGVFAECRDAASAAFRLRGG
jgi:hypothetical protein